MIYPPSPLLLSCVLFTPNDKVSRRHDLQSARRYAIIHGVIDIVVLEAELPETGADGKAPAASPHFVS